MVKTDIEHTVGKFRLKSKPEDRYTSFDYCYNYFIKRDNIADDIEKSCLVLGFYLASWGMFRGSSFLLQKSLKTFEPTIHYIASLDRTVWDIDVDRYDDKNIEKIIGIYRDIKERMIFNKNADLTLITKVLLGIFGFIPAFDIYFCKAFRAIADGQCGFRTVNKKSLVIVKKFYDANQKTIDKLSKNTFTIDFLTGQETKINYPKAKIIDMYGFTIGR